MAVNFTRQSPTWQDGHTVLAEDAERWEQLGTDVAAWSTRQEPRIANPFVLLRKSMPSPTWARSVSLGNAGSGDWITSWVNRLSLSAMFCNDENRSIDAVRFIVAAAGSADSVIRIGFYDSDPDTWRPVGTPIEGEITHSPANATGAVQIGLSPAIPILTGRPLFLAIVTQGTTAPVLPRQSLWNGNIGWYGTDANAAAEPAYTSNSTIPGVWIVESYTTALGDLTGVTMNSFSSAPLVGVRYV